MLHPFLLSLLWIIRVDSLRPMVRELHELVLDVDLGEGIQNHFRDMLLLLSDCFKGFRFNWRDSDLRRLFLNSAEFFLVWDYS